MLCERAAWKNLAFSALRRNLASILVASARSRVRSAALFGLPERPWPLPRDSWAVPGRSEDAPGRSRDISGTSWVTQEGPKVDIRTISGLPGCLPGAIFDRDSACSTTQTRRDATHRDEMRREDATTDEARKHDDVISPLLERSWVPRGLPRGSRDRF